MSPKAANITYRCVYAVLLPVALLPLPLLYVFSDILFVLIYYVVRYRRKLVRANMAISLADRTEAERRSYERRFYRNFADYVFETIKLLHISDRQMERRFTFSGLEQITGSMDADRCVVAYFSHCFNWEWAPCITLYCGPQLAAGDKFCQIYRPLRNRVFDRLMLKVRSRFHSVSIPKQLTLRHLLEMRRDDTVWVTGFMSDQKPSHGDAVHVIRFLGRATAVITGTGQLAHRMGAKAVYWNMSKPKRGHYHIEVVTLSDNAAEADPLALTDRYFSLLEQNIRRDPSLWLWTHNRWKGWAPDATVPGEAAPGVDNATKAE